MYILHSSLARYKWTNRCPKSKTTYFQCSISKLSSQFYIFEEKRANSMLEIYATYCANRKGRSRKF